MARAGGHRRCSVSFPYRVRMLGTVAERETWLVADLRGWAAIGDARPWGGGAGVYTSMWALVLDAGRLHTWAPYPGNLAPGEAGRCYRDAARLSASETDLLYAEGWAWSGLGAERHAWCVRPDGSVVDPTWTDATAYLGVTIPRPTLDVLAPHGQLLGPSPGEDWLRDGVPAGVLVDVGRPVAASRRTTGARGCE